MISIVIPIYNRVNFFSETLKSIQHQSYQNWECIVVDDGSDINSISFLKQMCSKDSRFKLLERNRLPKGASTCRNIGLQHASGDYILFLDSDDLLAPWCLQKRISFMEASPGLDFSVHYQLMFNQQPGDSRQLWSNTLNAEQSLIDFLNLNSPWPISGPLWKKTFLSQLEFCFDENAGNWQDCEFHIRCLLRSPSFKWDENSPLLPDGFIRIHQQKRISDVDSTDYIQNRINAFHRILPLLTSGQQHDFLNNIYSYFIHIINKCVLYQLVPCNNEWLYEIISTSKLPPNKKRKLRTYARIIKWIRMSGMFFVYRILRFWSRKKLTPYSSNPNLESLTENEIELLMIKFNSP